MINKKIDKIIKVLDKIIISLTLPAFMMISVGNENKLTSEETSSLIYSYYGIDLTFIIKSIVYLLSGALFIVPIITLEYLGFDTKYPS